MAISNQLIERGAAVTSLAVYLRGERRSRDGWFYHKPNLVVQANGLYFVCNNAPYIPDPAKEQTAQTRARSYERRKELSDSAAGQYMSVLERSQELRTYARDSLSTLAARIKIPL